VKCLEALPSRLVRGREELGSELTFLATNARKCAKSSTVAAEAFSSWVVVSLGTRPDPAPREVGKNSRYHGKSLLDRVPCPRLGR